MLDNLEDDKPSPEEKAHAKRLLKRIKAFDAALKERAKGWKKARNYADGDPEDDGEQGLVRPNLIGSMLETLQPALYAKAPEIAVTLDERADTTSYPYLDGFAQTLESALNIFLIKDAKLKTRGKAAVRGSLTTTLSWAKVVYQINKKDDPIIRNRINDTQDNVERINTLIEETKEEGGRCDEYEAKLLELNQQIDALQKQIEVVMSEGLVVDVLPPEDVIVLDASCREVDDYMQATEIAHRIKMTVGAFKEQFKRSPPKGVTRYKPDSDEEDATVGTEVDEDDYLIEVFEVWSIKDLTVYTVCKGAQGYVRPPYQPMALGEQWYPFFALQLRRVDGKKHPKSMVELLVELQDEYNTRRTNAAEHRKKNIPVRLLNKSAGITDDEVTKISNRSIKDDVIGVTMDANTPLQQQLGNLPEIPYNPAMYDTSDILRDMEMVGNTQDAARGSINKAKTATEAEIMSMGMQSRTSESLDVVEDWLTDISIYSAQLLLQKVPEAVIKRRFGDKAIWPQLNKKDLFELVDISIRAGSTAKPNKMRERDQWIQLLPQIQQSIEKITVYKQSGQLELMETTIQLLDETLRRFDERMDARELLGVTAQTEQVTPGPEQGALQLPLQEQQQPVLQ